MSAYLIVVEDEPDIAALVAYHLARGSYRVRTVADGTEALRPVERERPDLIILDLILPGTSNLDVLKALRGDSDLAAIPVILLTARKEEELVERRVRVQSRRQLLESVWDTTADRR